jgi:hypothetical protein
MPLTAVASRYPFADRSRCSSDTNGSMEPRLKVGGVLIVLFLLEIYVKELKAKSFY